MLAFLRSAARVFESELGIDVQLTGEEMRQDSVTTEDISVFLRVSGQIKGSIYFGMDRAVALELLTIERRHPASGIGAKSITNWNRLVGRIGGHVQCEFAGAGYSVGISSASTIRPIGMKIARFSAFHIVANLDIEKDPITAHMSLRRSTSEGVLAA